MARAEESHQDSLRKGERLVKRFDCHVGEYFQHPDGEFVRFADAQAETDRKLSAGIKTALCGEIRNLRDELTAMTLERDGLRREVDRLKHDLRHI
jgi:hypothetical protein